MWLLTWDFEKHEETKTNPSDVEGEKKGILRRELWWEVDKKEKGMLRVMEKWTKNENDLKKTTQTETLEGEGKLAYPTKRWRHFWPLIKRVWLGIENVWSGAGEKERKNYTFRFVWEHSIEGKWWKQARVQREWVCGLFSRENDSDTRTRRNSHRDRFRDSILWVHGLVCLPIKPFFQGNTPQ